MVSTGAVGTIRKKRHECSAILNERGYRSGYGHAFTPRLVGVVRENYALKSRYRRLRDRGLLTVLEAADRLGVSLSTVRKWRKAGLLRGQAYCDAGYCLLKSPTPRRPNSRDDGCRSDGQPRETLPHRNSEVQYEAYYRRQA